MAHTILVVDDDPDVLKIANDALTQKGYRVITAPDGKACLREIIVKKPDLIILDLKMPVMDGFSTLEMIKVMQPSRTTPVVVWSGHADEETFERVERMGADDVLTKALSMKEFTRRISAHLFSVDFPKLKEIFTKIAPANPDQVMVAQLPRDEMSDKTVFFGEIQEVPVCVLLEKSLSIAMVDQLSSSEAAKKVKVLYRFKDDWKVAWPKT